MQNAFGKRKVIFTFLLPAFILYTLFVAVSVVWACFYSFFDWNGVGSMTFAGLKNYMDLLTGDPVFWLSVKNTLIYTVVDVVIQVFGGLLFAIFLTRITHFRAGLQTLYYVPVVISSVAICQIFSKLFSVTPTGVINAVLGAVNPDLLYMEWISNRKLALYVAAIVDGANVVQEFIYVKIPYIMPVIVANCLLVLNGSLRSFDVSFLLTKGGPSNASELMSTYMYKQAFTSQRYGYRSAVAMAIVILCLVIGLGFRKMTAERE